MLAETPKVMEVKKGSDGNISYGQPKAGVACEVGGGAAKQCRVAAPDANDAVDDGNRWEENARKPLLGASAGWAVSQILGIVEVSSMLLAAPDAHACFLALILARRIAQPNSSAMVRM